MEHIEKIPLERADAGHLMHYMEYLKKNLIEGAETLSVIKKCCAHLSITCWVACIYSIHATWISRILCTPLDMFLNFLYAEGYCLGGMGEQQVKLATSPSDPVRTA